MREILFRGKRIDNGEWVESGSISRVSDDGVNWDYYLGAGALATYVLDEYKNMLAAITKAECLFYRVDPDSIGQYTGLIDRDGVKVFEGDILRLYEKETEHEADGYCVIHFGRFKDTDALADFDHLGWHITITTIPNEATTVFALEEQGLAFEIIGNIHDDREILDVK